MIISRAYKDGSRIFDEDIENAYIKITTKQIQWHQIYKKLNSLSLANDQL